MAITTLENPIMHLMKVAVPGKTKTYNIWVIVLVENYEDEKEWGFLYLGVVGRKNPVVIEYYVKNIKDTGEAEAGFLNKVGDFHKKAFLKIFDHSGILVGKTYSFNGTIEYDDAVKFLKSVAEHTYEFMRFMNNKLLEGENINDIANEFMYGKPDPKKLNSAKKFL